MNNKIQIGAKVQSKVGFNIHGSKLPAGIKGKVVDISDLNINSIRVAWETGSVTSVLADSNLVQL